MFNFRPFQRLPKVVLDDSFGKTRFTEQTVYQLYPMNIFLGIGEFLHFCSRKQTGGKLAMFTEWLEAEEGGSCAKLLTTHWGRKFLH